MSNNSLDQTIRDNASGPAEAHGDSGGVKQHPLPDQIAAERFLASKQAAKSRSRGIRFSKFAPPGAS